MSSSFPPVEPLVFAQTTVDSEERASAIARDMVEARLAACVQIDGPLKSVYEWQGRLEEATEWRLTAKTLASSAKPLSDWVAQHHPYDCPEWVTWESTSASPGYQVWVATAVKSKGKPAE